MTFNLSKLVRKTSEPGKFTFGNQAHSCDQPTGYLTQQHSLFSQASWGRVEMKPKRNKSHGSGTLIASFQSIYLGHDSAYVDWKTLSPESSQHSRPQAQIKEEGCIWFGEPA